MCCSFNLAFYSALLHRKRSPPHEGIVFLIAPSEWLKEEWELISSRVSLSALPNSLADNGRELAHEESSTLTLTGSTSPTVASRALRAHSSISSSEEDVEELELAEKSFSEPCSPTLSRRKTEMISFGERSRLLSHSSYDDLVSVLSDELEEAERVIPLDSPARKQHSFGLVTHPEPDASKEETVLVEPSPHTGSNQSQGWYPGISVVCPPSEEEAWNLDKKPPEPTFSSKASLEPTTDMSVTDNLVTDQDSEDKKDQEQQSGNILSRITGRLLQKVRSSTSESRLSASPEARPLTVGDSSSMKNVLQALRSSVVNWTNPSPIPTSSSSSAIATGQSALTLSEADMILEQMKQNSKTKFIYI